MSTRRIFITRGSVFLIILLLKISFVFLLSSCGIGKKTETLINGDKTKTNIKQDSDIKTDTLKYYYPVTLADENNLSTPADTSMLSSLSGSLLYAREPVIYTFNNEHDVYRLLVFDMESTIKIVSLHSDNGKVWLTVKELSRAAFLKPQKNGRFVPQLVSDGSIDSSGGVSYDEYEQMANMMPEKPKLIKNITFEFTKDTWDNMEYNIKQADYWKMPAYLNLDYRGNIHMLLEARVNGKYWLVDKIDAGGEFRKCCDYLLELKAISEKGAGRDDD